MAVTKERPRWATPWSIGGWRRRRRPSRGSHCEAIGGAVHLLGEREQIIIALYYYEGFTLAEIGQVLGVTESQVSQLHSRAMLQLRGLMVDAG